MDLILILSGIARLLISLAGVAVCARRLATAPRLARIGMVGFAMFALNSVVVVIIGTGLTFLIQWSSALALPALALMVASFASAIPRPPR